MVLSIEKTWWEKLQGFLSNDEMEKLKNFLAQEKAAGNTVYPPEDLIFNAFRKTPYADVKVVIIGQDPYHGPGQAHGLCFSVLPGVKIPPSLKNIFKELQDDVHITPPTHGCLESWTKQGVFLLNTLLSVRQGEPLSHQGKGWEHFTDAVIRVLGERKDPLVFLLWGKNAQEKCRPIVGSHHLFLPAAHPSPYSAHNFLGCRHFSKANAFLTKIGKEPINWNV